MIPRRIQRRRARGWKLPPGSVNVSRPTDWSNPFRVGDTVSVPYKVKRGGVWVDAPIEVIITPEAAVLLFEALVVAHRWEDQIRRELHGKDLVCWCAPDQPCHADVLLRIAN